ncbi:MAG: hypothetical protein LAP21_26430 [Acidobacteriia bacterium]|nr:hypothetical protein [Terriglobia bacterium]
MFTLSPRQLLLVLLVAFLGFSQRASAQNDVPTDTTEIQPSPQDDGSKRTDADQDDPNSRLQWQREAWGTVTATFRQNAIKEGKKHGEKKHLFGPRWVSIGPTGADFEQNASFTGHVRDSGRARTILPHPTDPNVVYILTSGGGLWRTNNWMSAHTNWTVLTDDLPTTGGGAVTFGKEPEILYLGLGDPFDQILVGGAVVKSRDGGRNWSPMIELGDAVSVRDIKVDTSTGKDIVFVATENGLYASFDEGMTYNAAPAFSGMSVWSIVQTSAGWLVSAQPCPAAAVGLQCGQPTTLFLSTDRGVTWAPISNAGNVFNNNGRTTLAVANTGESVVYAYSSNVPDSQMRDVYRSADGGQTWVSNGVNSTKIPTNPVPGSMPNMNICHGQCWYNESILVDPQDPNRNTVWIGGDLASARSSDGGASWTIKTWWLYSQVPSLAYAHADHHAAFYKMTGTPTVILGDDGGINISTDDGATFSSDKNNGLATHLYYTVAGNAALPNLVIGGLQDNGTRVRTDNGTTHNQVLGGDGMGAAYSQSNTNTVLGSSQGSSMRTSVTNTAPTVFQNWAAATSGLSDVGFGFFTAIVPAPASLDATGRVFFHFSNSRVWRSNNGGLTWTRIASAIAPTSPGLPVARRFRSSPYNLGVSPADLNHIAVGAAGGFLDITTNGGATWTDINLIALVPGYQGFITNVTWQDNQNLWITSVAQAPGSARVIKASIANPGDSWSTATFAVLQNGLPDLPVTRVYIDPRDVTRNTVYAATHVGIYRTVDGGTAWAPFGSGLPTVRVNDIYMPPDGSFIRIATYGRGIWELPQIDFVGAMLTDDKRSCDHDGVLDNGETGSLKITLKNQGRDVEHVAVTVTSSNPAVTFPRGNSIQFPGMERNGTRTASITVALKGAAPVDSTDFHITISAPELGLPGGLNFVSTHRINYDEQPSASTTESVEGSGSGWTIAGGATESPNVNSWQRRALSPLDHVWSGPDNNGQIDDLKGSLPDEQSLISPSMHVGTDPFTLSFRHRFSFENGGWDGGAIEISTDDGASWADIGTAAYNGSTNGSTSSPLGTNRRAFVNRMVGWPDFANVSLNLGTAFAGQDVRIRFRIGADDSTGAPGWDVDDIAVGGITNKPFSALVPNACTVKPGDRDDD